MSDVPTPLVTPRAARLRTPSWLDTRLLLGALLVLVSVVAGARVLAGADSTERVYAATHDLAPGTSVRADDLRAVRVRLFDTGQRYISATGAAPLGYVLTRALTAGELVPRDALAAAPPGDVRLVTLPVATHHYPAGLRHGDRVDVYLTRAGATRDRPVAPTLVLAAVPVDAVYDAGGARLGGSAAAGVELRVPAAAVARAVTAAQGGSVDLVRVPAAASPVVDRSP